jgi:hypothetical protein
MKTSSILTVATLLMGVAHAAPLKSASLTKKVNDVKISESSREARDANLGDKLTGSSTVLTGRQSRAELTFVDQTITRIGSNAAFRFNSGSRDLEITQGSFLLQVPKNAGGATIRTSTVTAAITGTTTMMEFSPGQWVKFICLEGTAKLRNKKGDNVDVPAGRMIVMHPNADKFPRPVIVNIRKMMKTSALTDEKTFGPLNPQAKDAIDDTIAQQMGDKRDGSLLPGYLLEHGQMPGGDDNKGGGGNRSILSEIDYQNNHNDDYYPYLDRPFPDSPGPGPSPSPGPFPPSPPI